MGNSSSSSSRAHHDDSVDYGSLVPQGVYTGQKDWNQNVVSQLIIARRLAPFYRPLEDYEDNWDDDQILAARKEPQDSEHSETTTRTDAASIAVSQSSSTKSKRTNTLKEPAKPEAQIYRGAVECPICFLYYPPNINHSRCCDQAICTECFVQIKRSEPTTTHIVSEPAACPYCVQDNFGVVYTPPPWRAGLGSEGYNPTWPDRSITESNIPPTHRRRQKSFGADSPDVVTTDQIRPDWEAKLEAVRAAVARRANRRIIMRQVGDRLIPVGVTSGRVHALSPEEAAAAAAAVENATNSTGRRSRRRRGDQPGAFEQFIGMGGQDLEELMLMEAMRLSLLEHEEHQRKEAEEKKKQEATKAAGSNGDLNPSEEIPTSTSPSAIPGPGPSTLEARSTSNLTSSSTSNLSVQGTIPASAPRSSSPSPHRHAATGSISTSALPTHTSSMSQDSLSASTSAGSNPQARSSSWSLSRSRTPPPPNPVTAVGVPMSEANDAAWRARVGSPPIVPGSKPKSALGTLSAAAALTSTSVGAAVLGGSREGSREGSRAPTPEPIQSTLKKEEPVRPPPPQTQIQTQTHDTLAPAQDTVLAPAIPSVMAPGTSIPMITVIHNDDTNTTPLTDELAAAMNEDNVAGEENPFLAPGEDGDEAEGSGADVSQIDVKNSVQDKGKGDRVESA